MAVREGGPDVAEPGGPALLKGSAYHPSTKEEDQKFKVVLS